MLIFAIQHIGEITGSIPFFKLIINGRCEFDEFEALIKEEGTWVGQLNSIQTRMQQVANRHSLPREKFYPLKGCKDSNTEYEIKTKDLRVYLFKDIKTGNVIVCGGKKGTQKEDIRHFRNLKKAYLLAKNKQIINVKSK